MRRLEKVKSPKKKRKSTQDGVAASTERTRGPRQGYAESDTEEDQPTRKQLLEDATRKGGWLRCTDCTQPLHWTCLNMKRRKAILQEVNDRLKPDEKPVKELGPEVDREDIPCEECYSNPAICYICSLDTVGRTEQEAIDAWGNEDEDDVSALGDFARPVFRCMRCMRTAHYECLVEPEKGEDEHGAAMKVQESYSWKCLDCYKWQTVEEILAWRYSNEPKVQVRPSRTKGDKEEKTKTEADVERDGLMKREYLVKFQHKSFRELAWVPHAWLSRTAQRLYNFLKMGSKLELEPISVDRDRIALTASAIKDANARDEQAILSSKSRDIEADEKDVLMLLRGPPEADPTAEQRIPKAWTLPEIILDVFFYPDILPNENQRQRAVRDSENKKRRKMRQKGGPVPPIDMFGLVHIDELEGTIYTIPDNASSAFQHVAYALVKWSDQGYDKCTWERVQNDDDRDAELEDAMLQAFERHLRGRDVLVCKPTEEDRKASEERAKGSFKEFKHQPKFLQGGKLMDFQLQGLNWLRYGWHKQQPGILADEMGLGKTVQAIAFIGALYYVEELSPFLVVVPNSTLPNWIREFQKWLPDLHVVAYYGEAASRRVIEQYELFHSSPPAEGYQALKADVVIVSDATMRTDPGPIQRVDSWEVLIVDEGHALKSGSNNVLYKKLASLDTNHRILLTGTPLNNNVGDLFNLLNFLAPNKWSDVDVLKSKYDVLTVESMKELQPRLRPYFLRRLKAQAISLPPKVELIIRPSLRPLQKKIYKSILENNVSDIVALTSTESPSKTKISKKKKTLPKMMNTLVQLRKCCQHA